MAYRLAEDHQLFDRLRRSPELLDGAVEEFLRIDSVGVRFVANGRSGHSRSVSARCPEATRLVLFGPQPRCARV